MADNLYVQSAYSFIQEFYDSNPSWLIENWLTLENFTVVSGQPQSYKTYLALDMATSIVSGNDFLGQFPVKRCGNVLILQMEDSYKNFAKRLLAIDNRYYSLFPTEVTDDSIIFHRNVENFIAIPRNYRFSFENPTTLLQLEKMIEIYKPVMVIIDPLRATSDDVDKYFAKVGKQIDDQLRPLRDKYKVGFTIVHHSNKSNGDDVQSNVYGSNMLIGAFESKLILKRVNTKDFNDNRIMVNRLYKEEGNLLPVQLTFKVDYKNEDIGQQYSVAIDEVTEDERKVMMISEYLIANGPTKIGDLCKKFDYPQSTLIYFLTKNDQAFVKTARGLWAVTPDKGD